MAPFNLFGLQLAIDPAWEDHTVYRFIAPPRDELAGVMAAKKSAQPLDNIVVSRQPVDPDSREADFLARAHDEAKRGAENFKVIQGGEGQVQGCAAAWEDTSQTLPGMALPVFQRHVAIRLAPNAMGLVVITGGRRQLDQIAKAAGLAVA